jgi:hypothetical protein
VTRAAERFEIVLAGGPQPDGAAQARVTAALLALVEGTLPRAVVAPVPAPVASAGPIVTRLYCKMLGFGV